MENLTMLANHLATEAQPWITNTGVVGGLLGAAVGVFGGGIYGPLTLLLSVRYRQAEHRRLGRPGDWFLVLWFLGAPSHIHRPDAEHAEKKEIEVGERGLPAS